MPKSFVNLFAVIIASAVIALLIPNLRGQDDDASKPAAEKAGTDRAKDDPPREADAPPKRDARRPEHEAERHRDERVEDEREEDEREEDGRRRELDQRLGELRGRLGELHARQRELEPTERREEQEEVSGQLRQTQLEIREIEVFLERELGREHNERSRPGFSRSCRACHQPGSNRDEDMSIRVEPIMEATRMLAEAGMGDLADLVHQRVREVHERDHRDPAGEHVRRREPRGREDRPGHERPRRVERREPDHHEGHPGPSELHEAVHELQKQIDQLRREVHELREAGRRRDHDRPDDRPPERERG